MYNDSMANVAGNMTKGNMTKTMNSDMGGLSIAEFLNANWTYIFIGAVGLVAAICGTIIALTVKQSPCYIKTSNERRRDKNKTNYSSVTKANNKTVSAEDVESATKHNTRNEKATKQYEGHPLPESYIPCVETDKYKVTSPNTSDTTKASNKDDSKPATYNSDVQSSQDPETAPQMCTDTNTAVA